MKFDGSSKMAEALRTGFIVTNDTLRAEGEEIWYEEGLLNPYRVGTEDTSRPVDQEWAWLGSSDEWKVADYGFGITTFSELSMRVDQNSDYTSEGIYPSRIRKDENGSLLFVEVEGSYINETPLKGISLNFSKHRWIKCLDTLEA